VAEFRAIPTPLRLRADPRFRGKGGTLALVDAAFFPHPDLARPANRIRAWADASNQDVRARRFTRDDVPVWPELPEDCRGAEWHGLMTSVTATGNGWLSCGIFRGLASECDVVLVQVSDGHAITSGAIARALKWLRTHALEMGLSVVSLSVAGDDPAPGEISPVDDEVEALVADGIVVVAAAGNDGIRHLLPPATCPDAITVGGLDDHNVLSPREWEIWHSNFGTTRCDVRKPEVVAPSLWTVAPVLPGSDVAKEAAQLFARRAGSPAPDVDRRIAELRLVTPHYQHVEGTSFAAPIVASIASCMLEANPGLTPERIKQLLMLSATRLPDAPDERQGSGVVNAGRAVAAALADTVTPARLDARDQAFEGTSARRNSTLPHAGQPCVS
jgi:serine protease AprX